MNFDQLNNIYFLGIGGIGMSALARYFSENGKNVGGYDKTPTPLTDDLAKQGMKIHFKDEVKLIPGEFLNKENTLIVRTPAVPANHSELHYFEEEGFKVMKRAQVLGLIFNSKKGIAVAGTHGKTSVCTFVSYLLKQCQIDTSAFLGGISKNYNSNLLIGKTEYVVAEADEFDRSFLQLHPYISLVTAIDADHLDIYDDYNDIKNTFSQFVSQNSSQGILILRKGIELDLNPEGKVLTYSLDDKASDIYASEIEPADGTYIFTLNTPNGSFKDFRLAVPGKTNIENTLAAISICYALGISEEQIKKALPDMKGVVRRFDLQYQGNSGTYIDDYAHHPSELDAVIGSIREMYPGKKITGVFQPHLYTRTRDFAKEFADSLSKLDELILMDIYPAREKPLPGVTSERLLRMIEMKNKYYCSKENLLRKIKDLNIEVLLTLGAGDIDVFVTPIKNYFLQQSEEN